MSFSPKKKVFNENLLGQKRNLTGCAEHWLALGSADGDVVGPDDVHQQFDVSIGQILSRHLLSLFPLRFQRPLGLSQLEKVDSQKPECQEKHLGSTIHLKGHQTDCIHGPMTNICHWQFSPSRYLQFYNHSTHVLQVYLNMSFACDLWWQRKSRQHNEVKTDSYGVHLYLLCTTAVFQHEEQINYCFVTLCIELCFIILSVNVRSISWANLLHWFSLVKNILQHNFNKYCNSYITNSPYI